MNSAQSHSINNSSNISLAYSIQHGVAKVAAIKAHDGYCIASQMKKNSSFWVPLNIGLKLPKNDLVSYVITINILTHAE